MAHTICEQIEDTIMNNFGIGSAIELRVTLSANRGSKSESCRGTEKLHKLMPQSVLIEVMTSLKFRLFRV